MSQQYELLTESPGQWTSASYVIPEIQKKEIKPFVVLSLKELEGNPDSRTSSLTNSNKFSAVRAVVRHIARSRSATKEPWCASDVRNFLENLKFSQECAEELTTLLCTDKIYDNIPRHLRMKPGLVSMQWKIDLSLCQNNIETENANPERYKEIMQRDTHIILIFKLTDGQMKTYRLSIAKFHELRWQMSKRPPEFAKIARHLPLINGERDNQMEDISPYASPLPPNSLSFPILTLIKKDGKRKIKIRPN